jgi:hypothetical protein
MTIFINRHVTLYKIYLLKFNIAIIFSVKQIIKHLKLFSDNPYMF